jgi:dTDP-4-amino-4,6-dideoxygalactose transaminase
MREAMTEPNVSPSPTDYERAFAAAVGARHAFAFWKGRVALYAILEGLGVGPGDEIILPGYTCVMDVNPIMYLGAKPVYVDIEPATYNLDPALLEAKVTSRTRVIIAQHTYGYPAAMDDILAVAGRHGITVIEDCCLSFGSTRMGKPVGTFGAASYYSSQWSKPYTTGLGGMAATSDDGLAERIGRLRAERLIAPGRKQTAMLAAQLAVYRTLIYPRTTALATMTFRALTRMGLVVGSSNLEEFRPVMAPDFFKGMSRLQQRAGLRGLRRAADMMAHRRRIAKLYDELLTERGWRLPAIPAHLDPVLVRYPVRVADKARALAGAAWRFVELGSWFECPLHPRETPLESYGYHEGMCPVAEKASREVVNLPTHPRVNEKTARRGVEYLATIGPPAE